jgi:hypothetical protein
MELLWLSSIYFLGYVRYLNDRREAVRAANPNLSFAEITKMLANEWTNLLVDKKQQYLDAAEQDRVRYTREYNAYKQTEVYKLFMQQQNEKKVKVSKEELKQTISIVLDKFGFVRKFSECRPGSARNH